MQCNAGRCDAVCSSPNTRCPATKGHKFPYCSDLFNDPANCGGCAFGCSDRANATSTCSAALCGVKCDGGYADCDGSVATGCEIKLASDPNNCGACGKVCDAGTSCVAGACGGSCALPKKACGTDCVDVQNDVKNCGDCGNVCGAEDLCISGKCTAAPGCAPPNLLCGSLCVDPTHDSFNCGGCGKTCAPGTACVASACTSAVTCASGPGTALFYGATGSVESPYVAGAGLTVEIADEAAWRTKTTADFAKYRLIVIGEPDASTTTAPMLQAAYDTRKTWGPAVTGRIAVLGMPAGSKAKSGVAGAVLLLKPTMLWLASGPVGTTSLFVATDWGTRGLDYLEPFGLFGESTASGDDAKPIVAHPMLVSSTDTTLSGWALSVRALITTYPSSFTGIAKGLGGPPLTTPPSPTGITIVARDVPCSP